MPQMKKYQPGHEFVPQPRVDAGMPWSWPPSHEAFRKAANRFDIGGLACYFGVPRSEIEAYREAMKRNSAKDPSRF